jgi:hypothetical protein
MRPLKTVAHQALVLYEPSKVQFADYLRPCFRYAGFPILQDDEARLLAKEQGEAIPPGYLALIEVARQVNRWWSQGKVAVICDRPSELYRNDEGLLHNANGPALVYRNGWQVHAVDGKWIEPPRIANSQPSWRDPARLLERYHAGDRISVWNDLRVLEINKYEAEAQAVAYATMERARQNVIPSSSASSNSTSSSPTSRTRG